MRSLSIMSSMKSSQFCCMTCKYFTTSKSNLQKHFHTKKHLLQVNPEVVGVTIASKYQCKVCDKRYKSQSGLWKHLHVCKAPPETVNIDLHAKIDNLEKVIDKLTDLVKNQQPSTTINNNNINIFLNDKCHNAYDIRKFIANIDFSKENFEKIIMDYVGSNAEIITKNYKSLPEYERPLYVFNGEDEHQKVAHIQYDNKWVVERELGWEKQVRREYNEGTDEPEANSMYSLVRLFDKKKMEYFDENYRESHLRLSQKKLHKDCLDDGKQLELINKIIDMVSIEPE
jgi:Zinc-finger of C2H2 type